MKDVKAEPLRRRPRPSCNIVLKAKRKTVEPRNFFRVRSHDAPLLGSVNDEPFRSSRVGDEVVIPLNRPLVKASRARDSAYARPARSPEALDPVTADPIAHSPSWRKWWMVDLASAAGG